MKRLIGACTAAAVLSLAACGDATTGDGTSGIRETAHIGPQCPVVTAESPCPDLPFEGEVRVSTPDGEQVATAPTDSTGAFEITLAPGIYVVDVVVGGAGGPPFAKPLNVDVTAGSFTEVDLAVDSGIR